MAVKKSINTPETIANKVIVELDVAILKIIKDHIKSAVEYATEDGIVGYCWEDDFNDSGLGSDLSQLIGNYLEEHLVVETKFILAE